jgi:hypothetical protein
MKYSIALICFVLLSSFLHALTPDEVIQKITAQRTLLNDWSAIYTQEISGSLLGKGDVEMGRITVKGDHTRKDIQRPIRKTRIQTPLLTLEKDEASGEVVATDLSQKTGPMGTPRMTPEEALRQFSFQVVSETDAEIVLEGVHESVRMAVVVDAVLFVPTRMTMDLPAGTRMTMTQRYAVISEIPMLVGSETSIDMRMGTRAETMKVVLTYKNLKVNTGVLDAVFKL